MNYYEHTIKMTIDLDCTFPISLADLAIGSSQLLDWIEFLDNDSNEAPGDSGRSWWDQRQASWQRVDPWRTPTGSWEKWTIFSGLQIKLLWKNSQFLACLKQISHPSLPKFTDKMADFLSVIWINFSVCIWVFLPLYYETRQGNKLQFL